VKWQPLTVVSRKEFIQLLRQYVKKPLKRFVDKVILHHTDKPRYKDWERKPDASYWLKAIDRAHRMSGYLNATMIGYHVVIFPDGSIGLGRPLEKIGAHCRGMNQTSIGVALFGCFNKGEDKMSPQQYISLKYVVASLLVVIGQDENSLYFHRNFSSTDCPGTSMDLAITREIIKAVIPEAKEMLREEK